MPKPPRTYKTAAIVLRQRRLGDADKIITLYTADHGKVDAVAKGVRRVKSRLAGHVEPLIHGSYMFARGRNLDIITQAQALESFPPLHRNLERLSRALYIAELVDRATEEREENSEIYRLLLESLHRLAERDDLDLIVRFFEMAMLVLLGYRPELQRCVVCSSNLDGGHLAWAASAGGVICQSCQPGANTAIRPITANALEALRFLQDGMYDETAHLPISPNVAGELERHLRDAIHNALDRDIRSASFVDAVRRKRPQRFSQRAGPR